MAGKYLLQNCLCVHDSTAVAAVEALVSENAPQKVYTSSFNRDSNERKAFLNKVKISRR